MSSRALSKKSFGIKNEKLPENSGTTGAAYIRRDFSHLSHFSQFFRIKSTWLKALPSNYQVLLLHGPDACELGQPRPVLNRQWQLPAALIQFQLSADDPMRRGVVVPSNTPKANPVKLSEHSRLSAKKTAEALRKALNRLHESEDVKKKRKTVNAARTAKKRSEETANDRKQRLASNKAQTSRARAKETDEAAAARRASDASNKSKARSEESDAVRAERRVQDAHRKAITRSEESQETADARRYADRQRHAAPANQQQYLGLARREAQVEEHYLGQIYVLYYADKSMMGGTDLNSSTTAFVAYHAFAFLVFQYFLGIFLITFVDNFSAKTARVLQCLTVVSFLYNYNPWIIYYQHSVHQIYIAFKYFFMLITFLVPGLLLTSVFSSWIFWRMSRIDSDYEPCEVIYGGEDSVTKKLLDDF
ncbi:unnamed protein product [Caenorhabditis brenneri]